jgi:iron complex outermembrane receptor protein
MNVCRLHLPVLHCSALAASAAVLSAVAAEQSPPASGVPPVQLPAVEVVESPLATVPEADRFSAAVTTISASQLQEMNALDFADALRHTPGVTITRYNQVGSFGGDQGGAVFLRGLGVSRPGGEIKTLVDGVPKLNGIFNHPLLDLMSVDLASRIDVYARATPLDFGNTFAAINVTTPRVTAPGEVVNATAAAGSFGTIVERLDLGAREGAFDTYFSQSIRQSDGQRPDSGGHMENYLLRLGWALSPQWDLSYVLNHTRNRATDPGVEGSPLGPPSTRGELYETADWLHIATLTNHYGLATGTLRVYLNDGEGNWIRRQFSGNADSLNDWRLYGARWREALQPWEGGQIVAGADLDYDRGTSRSVPPAPAPESAFGPMTLRLFSLYVGVSHTVTLGADTRITPSAGGRYYQHSVFDSQFAPQAGVTVSSGRTQWHAGYSRAVNYPGLEVAVFSQMFIPALGQSWRALRPEQADQFEVGVRQAFAAKSAVAVTLFRNDMHDRYQIVFPPPPPPRYLNLSSSRTEGIEITADTAPGKDLALFAGVSLLRATPDGLPYAPKSTFTGGLNWRIAPGWFLSTDGVYVSSMHEATEARVAGAANPVVVGAHFLLNARIARRFSWGAQTRNRGEFYVSGENLTDRRFAYQPGYSIPGINFMIGLRFER